MTLGIVERGGVWRASHYDDWQNVPESLPDYITVLGIEPHDAIGWGLSKEMADEIASG
jgi:hypothetical protein